MTQQWISKINKKPYEVQIDNFKCGPVAIINAFHFKNINPGRSLRRLIITTCNTKEIHEDGFNGTKPDNLGEVLNRMFQDKVHHFVGIRECIRSLRNSTFTGYIVLYSFIKDKKQYYHYIFTYKLFNNIDNSITYYSQNDGSSIEIPWSLNKFITEHLSLEGAIPVHYPQIWAIT